MPHLVIGEASAARNSPNSAYESLSPQRWVSRELDWLVGSTLLGNGQNGAEQDLYVKPNAAALNVGDV